MNRCLSCEYADECPLEMIINFCEDCKDYDECTIRNFYCKNGFEIECNNGFEDKDDEYPYYYLFVYKGKRYKYIFGKLVEENIENDK